MKLAVLYTVFVLLLGKEASCGKAEKQLLRNLFDPNRVDAHNILENPSINESISVDVKMSISLIHIFDVDEKNQILHTNFWPHLYWKDYHFKWEPSMYNNIRLLSIPANMVWKPDIVLYNGVDTRFESTFPINVIVKENSEILYIPSVFAKTTCRIDMRWFPFDRHKCNLKFGSWTNSVNTLNISYECTNRENCNQTGGRVPTDYFIRNTEWDLLSFSFIRHEMSYPCCQEKYVDITFYVEIKRRTLYSAFSLLVSCVIVSVMALLGFLIPPDAGEKLPFGAIVLLSFTGLLLLVAEKMPLSDIGLPVIGVYFTSQMVLCSLSLMFTVLALNCHHSCAEMPDSFTLIFNVWLAKLVLLTPRRNGCYNDDNKYVLSMAEKISRCSEGVQKVDGTHASEEVVSHLRRITATISESTMKQIQANKWTLAARVMDRLCFIIFCIIAIIFLIMFTTHP